MEEGGVIARADERLTKTCHETLYRTRVIRVEDLCGGKLACKTEFAAEQVARQDERACADNLGRLARSGGWGEKLDCELD